MDFSFFLLDAEIWERKNLILHPINKKMKNKTKLFLLKFSFMSNISEIFDLEKKC